MFKHESALEGKRGWCKIWMAYYQTFTQEKFKIHSLLVTGTDFFWMFIKLRGARIILRWPWIACNIADGWVVLLQLTTSFYELKWNVSENKTIVGDDDLWWFICFSCLKKSKKFVQTYMRRSELFLQTSIRMTLPSARRTCRSFFRTQTSSSTVPLPCALMTTSGTVQVPFHDLYYTCVCTCMCKFLHYVSFKKRDILNENKGVNLF